MVRNITQYADVDRRTILKAAGVAGTVGLAGCIGDEGGEGGTQDVDVPDIPQGGDEDLSNVREGGTFIGTLGANISNYDPTEITDTTSRKAFALTYESLLEVNFDGEPQPVLAADYEQLDETSFEFSLREGVRFHNGDEMTAEDVQASIERYEGTPREGTVYDWYEGSEIVDDYTIRLDLQRPFAPFLTALHEVWIVPAAAANGDIDLSNEPVGTGPFQFVDHQDDSHFEVRRFEDYWWESDDDMPEVAPIETVRLEIITEQSVQQSALESGDVDMINTPPPESISDLYESDEYAATQTVGTGYDMVIFPVEQGPFVNEKVRRGITRLIRREEIVNAVFHGHAEVAHTPISPVIPDYYDEEFEQEMADEYVGFDEETARELIEDGFEEEGVEAPYEVDFITNDNPVRVQWAQLVQQELEQSELFEINLDEMEWSTYVQFISQEDSADHEHLVALGWSAGMDPDDYLREMMTTAQQTPACCNSNHYSNEEFDSLVSEAQEYFEPDERAELYRDAERIVAEEAPIAFLWNGTQNEVVRADRVKNWRTYPEDGYQLNALYKPYFGQVTWLEGDE
ncbi:ABC transporter substrate-binding protein [Haloferacaceae archaeon DSL9]